MSVKISSLNTASTIDSRDDITIAGNNPLAFSDWGGGWFMQDGTWIRSYNSKSLWMDSGKIGADGGLTIGYGGAAPSTGGAIIAGNVGIGTTTPNAPLDVISATTSSSGLQQWSYNSSPGNYRLQLNTIVTSGLVKYSFDMLNAGTAYNNTLVLTNGNVLIGTTTDSGYTLVVNGGQYGTLLKGGDTGTGSDVVRMVKSDNSVAMLVRGDGNVGIGTTNPLYRLESSTTALFGTTAYGVLNIAADNPTYIKIKTNIPFSYGAQGYTVNIKGFQYGGSQTLDLQVCWHQYADAFYSQTITSKGSFAPVVRLARESGLVVIVLTWGQYWPKLYVESVHNYVNNGYANGWTWVDENVTGDKTVTLSYKNDFGDGFVKTAAGLVGIGTNSPSAKLDVQGTNSNGLIQAYVTSGGGNALRLNSNFGGGNYIDLNPYISGVSNGGFEIKQNGTQRFVIADATGYIGIGTTSPTTKLTILDTSAITNHIDIVGYGVNAKGHIGQFYGNLYLSSNYFYNGTQNADDSSYGQAAVVISAGITNTSYIDFNLSDAGASNPSSKVRITSAGNVLIGTTTDAGYKLDVNGTARFSGNLRVDGTSNGYLTLNATSTGGNESGIFFQVGGANKWENYTANNDTALNWYSYGSSSIVFKLASTGAATFSSLAGSGSRMVVADASGVLSTQTIPGGVSGSGTTDYLPKWTGTSDLGDSIISEGSGIINVAGNVRTNNTNGILTLSNGNTSGGNKIQSWNTASNADGYLAFEGYTIEYGRFDASGQLGIGTTTPATALDVVGGAYTNTTAKFGAGMPIYLINNDPHIGFNTYYDSGWKYGAASSGSFAGTLGCAQSTGDFTLQTSTAGGNAGNTATLVALMTWKQNGFVGIGTNTPSQRLEVNGNIKLSSTAGATATPSYIWLGNDYSNGVTRNKLKIYLYNSGTEQYGFTVGSIGDVQYHSNSYHDFYIANTLSLRINSSGDVGIGTSSPQGKLSVDGGDIRFNYGNAAANHYIWFNHNNSYDGGVLWTRNNSTLDWQMVNAASSGNFWLYSYGTSTVAFAIQRATGYVGIGTLSPEYILDVNGRSRFNGIIIGRGAGDISTNVGLGANPLFSNTSGSENTAVGYLPMYSNTSGIRNTALGNNALYSNLSGSSNVAIGAGSLYSNLDGRYNSSVGYNSMQFMRGEYNSALGRDSMRGSLTAANNTGQYNTAVGYESMLLLTSGNWNTAVGNQTGASLSTGSYNTFIGRSSVAAAGGLVTTGSNNTIIGGYGGTTTLANTVVLADGAGQVQLWATGKNVAFGTTSPTTYANYTTLHIAGQTTTTGGVLRLTTSDSSTAVNIFTNNVGANYDTTTSHPHYFNINGATNLIVSTDGITTADPGNGAVPWKLGDVQNAAVSLITNQYIEVEINGAYYRLAIMQPE